jgi:TonB family protein
VLYRWIQALDGYNINSMRLICCVVACATALQAQDWTPRRIVAITDYVPLARQARIAGDVQIKCTLRADGSVNNAEVLSGHPLLKEDARQNALLWRFQRSSAQVTSNTVILKYQYRLEGNPGSRTVFMVDLPDVIQIISPLPVLNP